MLNLKLYNQSWWCLSNKTGLLIKLEGATGGHSGVEIDKEGANIDKVNPTTINTRKIIVFSMDFAFKYKYFPSFISYIESNPLISAYKPFPADHNVNIIEIDIVPYDFEYTSCTIPNTISFILDGINFDIASNNVCGAMLVY